MLCNILSLLQKWVFPTETEIEDPVVAAIEPVDNTECSTDPTILQLMELEKRIDACQNGIDGMTRKSVI